MIYLSFTTYISVDLVHHEIFRATVGNVGITINMARKRVTYKCCIPVWAFTDFLCVS